MIGRIAAQMLDPYFVREEELAALLERKTRINVEVRNRPMGTIVGNGYVEMTVPTNHEWLIYSISVFEPTDAGAGSLPKTHCIELYDDLANRFMTIGQRDLPMTIAQSYLTYGLDLPDAINDNGQLPPSYWITTALPQIVMKGSYTIVVRRNGIGGAPITDATVRIMYLERF